MRVDLWLVEKGLAPSRNRARELVERGCVFLLKLDHKSPVLKASQNISAEDSSFLVVESQDDIGAFVSRGGLKMKGALARIQLSVTGFRALDVGLSTGGFTDCLLQAGVSSVVGLDVGRGQLAEKLRKDARIQSIEGVNARDLSQIPLIAMNAGHKFDLIVIDVSFISLVLVLPEVIQYLSKDGHLLALVKPQFEVGREGLGKNGIVKDSALYRDVEEKIRNTCSTHALKVEDYFESSIEGSDGNREFFVHARFN